MRIAVIGGSGFIGTSLLRRLIEAKHKVLNIDKARSAEFTYLTTLCDVRNTADLEPLLREKDAVVLLAAEHKDNIEPSSLYYEVNVGGAQNVAEIASRHGIKRILFTSSASVYPFSKEEMSESSPAAPWSHYGRSKLQAEQVLRDWALADPSRCLIIVRPVSVFGPQGKGNINNLFQAIASRRFLMVGDGRNVKSIAYIENVVDFLVFLLERFDSGMHLFNYADKPDLEVRDLVKLIRTTLGKGEMSLRLPVALTLGAAHFLNLLGIAGQKAVIAPARIRKFCATTQVSSSRARESGFAPRYSLTQALKLTLKELYPQAVKIADPLAALLKF